MANRVRGVATLALISAVWTSGCAGLALQLPLAVISQNASPALVEAQRLERAGDLPAAREAYARIVEGQPLNSVALHRLAVVCTLQGDHAAAAEAYNRALQLTPKDVELLTDAGYACYVRQEYEAAEALLKLALRYDPAEPRASNNLGLVLGMAGKPTEALAAFERSQTPAMAQKSLAQVHRQRGDLDQAAACYQRARELDPGIEIPPQFHRRSDPAPAPENLPAERVVEVIPADPVPSDEVTVEAAPVAPIEAAETYELSSEEAPMTSEMFAEDIDEENVEFLEPAIVNDPDAPAIEVWSDRSEPGETFPPQSAADTVSVRASTEPPTKTSSDLAIVQPGWFVEQPQSALGMVFEPYNDGSQKPADPDEAWNDELFVESNEIAVAVEEPVDIAVEELIDQPGSALSDASEISFGDDEEVAPASFEKPPAEPIVESPVETLPTHERILKLADICLVTLKDERLLVEADPQFTALYQEQTYAFVSEAAAEQFRLRPVRYVPVAGGLDVVAVHGGQAVVEGTLEHAAWYRDRLYLFSSADHLDRFRGEPAEFVSLIPVEESQASGVDPLPATR